MSSFSTAKLTNAMVFWSDGVTPFSGYMLLALSLPTGYSSAYFEPKFPRQRMPLRLKVPITNGLYDPATAVPFNTSIDPPNTQYVAFWFDVNNVQIAGPSALFTVSGETVTPPTPTLTIPAVSGAIPVPNVLP